MKVKSLCLTDPQPKPRATVAIFNEEAKTTVDQTDLDSQHKICLMFYYFLLRVSVKPKILLKAKDVYFAMNFIFDTEDLSGEPSHQDPHNPNFKALRQNYDIYEFETTLNEIFMKYGTRFIKRDSSMLHQWSKIYLLKRLESHIEFTQKNYKKAFQILLDPGNHRRVQMWTFKIIKNVLGNQKALDRDSQSIFKESVLFCLRDLLMLDKSESEKVLDIMFAYQEKELIQYLRGFPDLQFEYVEKLLKKDNFNLELREQYLDLLCRLKPKKV
jgi:hypothetical protein